MTISMNFPAIEDELRHLLNVITAMEGHVTQITAEKKTLLQVFQGQSSEQFQVHMSNLERQLNDYTANLTSLKGATQSAADAVKAADNQGAARF